MLIVVFRLNLVNNIFFNVGLMINVSVYDVLCYVMSCGKNFGVEVSARYVFIIGFVFANASFSMRKSKNVLNDVLDCIYNFCKINFIFIFIKFNMMIGF